LTKSLVFDDFTNLSQLDKVWASKSNLKQRKGRAGRVSDGFCYRLIRRSFYENLDEYPKPAIEMQPLDKLILNLKRFKALSEFSITHILSLSLTQPKLDNIELTVLRLKEVGALSIYKNDEHCDLDGDLTFAGALMGQLPCDIKLGKLILLGHCFGRLRYFS
jgi:ATP-dependent RNA helicase TDRD9